MVCVVAAWFFSFFLSLHKHYTVSSLKEVSVFLFLATLSSAPGTGKHYCLANITVFVQALSGVQLFSMDCSTPGFPVLHRFCSDSYPLMPSNYLNLYHPLLPLPSIFPNIRVFSNELPLCIRWPKYWSFSFSINSFNEYSRLISFGIGWFDLFAVQRTFKSLLQHHSSKAPILQCSAFFMVQLSH